MVRTGPDRGQSIYKIDKNISKTESNRTVESSSGKSLTVKINVSNYPVRNGDKERKNYRDKKKRETYCKRKIIRTMNAQRNKYQTAKTEVSDDCDKGGTYQMRE